MSSCSRNSRLPARAASQDASWQGRRAKTALKRSGFYPLDQQIFWKQGFKLILTKRAHHFNRHTRCKLGPRPVPCREEMCFGKQTQDGKRDSSMLQQPQDQDSLGFTGLLQTPKCQETLPWHYSITQAASCSTELCRGCWRSGGHFRLAHRNHPRAEDLVSQGLQSFNQVTKTPRAQGSKFSSNLLDCRGQGQA